MEVSWEIEKENFRWHRIPIDNIFSLTSMISLRFEYKKGKLYCFFVVFSRDFYMINRRVLFNKLACLSLFAQLLSVLEILYNKTSAGI